MVQAVNLPKKDLLRPDEVAAFFNLSPKTIYAWMDSGKIESVIIAGTVKRIPFQAVEKLIRETIG